MKNRYFVYHSSLFPPLFLAIFLIVLPQLAKSANNTQPDVKLSNKQFHTLSTHPLSIDLNKPGSNELQKYSGYYRPKMASASPMLKTAILKYEKHHSKRDPTSYNSLQNCQLFTTEIELDQHRTTREWLVSTPKNCQPATSTQTIWLLQSEANQAPQILMKERTNTLKISLTLNHGHRNISTALNTRLTISNKTHEAICRKSWRYNGKAYNSGGENIKIWGQPALSGGAAYWHEINHVYPDPNEKLPVECSRH